MKMLTKEDKRSETINILKKINYSEESFDCKNSRDRSIVLPEEFMRRINSFNFKKNG